MNVSAEEALERLKAGNKRFVAKMSEQGRDSSTELVSGQRPYAIFLGCSDSRVPIEYIFDQGFGDLFIIRVAGNVVNPSQTGSVEFAVENFGTRLVVVLGHTSCGAVQATLGELQRPTEDQSVGLRSIVDRIAPSVKSLLESDLRHDPEALMATAVKSNIRTAVDDLRKSSGFIDDHVRNEGLKIVGAEYSLATGEVTFLDQD